MFPPGLPFSISWLPPRWRLAARTNRSVGPLSRSYAVSSGEPGRRRLIERAIKGSNAWDLAWEPVPCLHMERSHFITSPNGRTRAASTARGTLVSAPSRLLSFLRHCSCARCLVLDLNVRSGLCRTRLSLGLSTYQVLDDYIHFDASRPPPESYLLSSDGKVTAYYEFVPFINIPVL